MKNIYVDSAALKIIDKSVEHNVPLLLVGETGTGKTTLLREIAKLKKKELVRVSLNGSTGTEEILGKYVLNEGATHWQDGILTRAVRNGTWIVFDELNSCSPEILFSLHAILDDERTLVLAEKDNEKVPAHKDFRFFASINPEDYAGTKVMNQAFLSRFAIIEIDHMSEADEIKFLIDKHTIDEKIAGQLVSVATTLRKLKKDQQIDYFCCTRDLEIAANFAKTLPLETALMSAVFNKMNALEKDVIKQGKTISHFVVANKGTLDTKLAELRAVQKQIEGYESKLAELATAELKLVAVTKNIQVNEKAMKEKWSALEVKEKALDDAIKVEVKKRIQSLIS